MSLNNENDNQIEAIASQLLYHKRLFYSGRSIISDAEYDALENDLKKLSPEHPVLSLVGYNFEDSGKKISHFVPMLSLAKTYSLEDLYDFINKNSCIVMDKVDGMALSIEYDGSGKFLRASTRGNGKFGEDVSEHVFYVPNIPKKIFIKNKNIDFHYEIRGEVYFPKSEFKKFEDRFDSFRNAVPGTLGRKEVGDVIDILKVFRFFAYDILIFKDNQALSANEIQKNYKIANNYYAKMDILKQIEFSRTIDHIIELKNISSIEDLSLFIEEWYQKRRDYHIDGIVFRVQDEILWENLGTTSHHPRGTLAFKQAGETAETEILAIEESIGRSGKITFRAKLKTVELSGAKISFATLHNAEFIEQGNYSVGAKVEIIRSGEVIPAIVRLIEPSKKAFEFPKFCKCGFPLTRQGPDLICLEKRSCNFKDQESLVYFVSTLDILGVSDKIVLKIRESGLVQEPADFYKLTVNDLIQLEGFAQKSSENVVNAIQNSKKIPLAKFLTALGLKRGGAVKCQEVARKFVSLKNVLNLTPEDLLKEKGWAIKSANDFIISLHDKIKIIQNLLKFVIVLDDNSVDLIYENSKHPFFRKNICITGTLSRPRDEYKILLEKIGAKLVTSVTSRTDFLVCSNASNSTKYKDALKYNIKIISEEDFSSQILF